MRREGWSVGKGGMERKVFRKGGWVLEESVRREGKGAWVSECKVEGRWGGEGKKRGKGGIRTERGKRTLGKEHPKDGEKHCSV